MPAFGRNKLIIEKLDRHPAGRAIISDWPVNFFRTFINLDLNRKFWMNFKRLLIDNCEKLFQQPLVSLTMLTCTDLAKRLIVVCWTYHFLFIIWYNRKVALFKFVDECDLRLSKFVIGYLRKGLLKQDLSRTHLCGEVLPKLEHDLLKGNTLYKFSYFHIRKRHYSQSKINKSSRN